MKAKELPSLEWLDEWISYDAETGKLYWKKQRHPLYAIAGGEAGGMSPRGYIRVGIKGNYYQAHRICWTIHHQEVLPLEAILDHINGDKTDNRICNLRLATCSENNHNKQLNPRNKTGVKGVFYYPANSSIRPWMVTIKINDKQHYLGTYSTLDEAKEVRKRAEQEHLSHIYTEE
jgi:hypothetical protein